MRKRRYTQARAIGMKDHHVKPTGVSPAEWRRGTPGLRPAAAGTDRPEDPRTLRRVPGRGAKQAQREAPAENRVHEREQVAVPGGQRGPDAGGRPGRAG